MKHLMSGDDGKGNKGILHLSMAPLSKEEMGTLMAGVIGASPPTRIVQHVLDRTKGNVLVENCFSSLRNLYSLCHYILGCNYRENNLFSSFIFSY